MKLEVGVQNHELHVKFARDRYCKVLETDYFINNKKRRATSFVLRKATRFASTTQQIFLFGLVKKKARAAILNHNGCALQPKKSGLYVDLEVGVRGSSSSK